MSSSRKRIGASERQLQLFDGFVELAQAAKAPRKPGSLSHGEIIRKLLKEAVRKCPKSREEIADAMTVLTGERITERMLDAMICRSHQSHRFPAQWASAFCAVTESRELLQTIAESLGCRVLEGADLLLVELGRVELERRQIVDRDRAVRLALGRMTEEERR